MKMTFDMFEKMYGHLLPNEWLKMAREMMKRTESMIVPDPTGTFMIEIVK